MRLSIFAGFAISVVLSFVSEAHAQNFNFESLPASYPPGDAPGALTTLVMFNAGLTVTLTRQDGSAFDIVDNTISPQTGKPVAWGARSLSPFFDTSNTAFVLNFSQPVAGVSIQLGDYAQDFDDLAFLIAYAGSDGTGTLLNDSSTVYGNGAFPDVLSLSVSANGIRSVTFGGGSSLGPQSLFWDNLVVAVPTPASACILPLLGMFTARRRRV